MAETTPEVKVAEWEMTEATADGTRYVRAAGYFPLRSAPPLPLERVEWRIDSKPFPRGDGHVARYVPYLDAAIAADLLDRWVGPGRWRDRYVADTLGGRDVLWCHIAIEVQPGVWVEKSDLGVAPAGGDSPQGLVEKGTVSDAFKRCAILKWGVGRLVYDLPTLWAPCKVRERGGREPVALPAPNVEGILVAQLVEQGYTLDGTTTRAEPGDDSEPGDEPTGAPAATLPERWERLVERAGGDHAAALRHGLDEVGGSRKNGLILLQQMADTLGVEVPSEPFVAQEWAAEHAGALWRLIAAHQERPL